MSDRLSAQEMEHLDAVIRDFETISAIDAIEIGEVNSVAEQLESDEVAQYLRNLRDGEAPESVLREELMAGASSVLANFFFGRINPAVTTSQNGYLDYEITGAPPMLLELKSLFEQRQDGDGEIVSLVQRELEWRDHRERIEKYRTDNEFLIVTNLKTWYCFSRKSPEPIHDEPIAFEEFVSEFGQGTNLRDYLRRLQERNSRSDLDEKFFGSLNDWVSKLGDIEFESDESETTERIVNLVNKCIFIQTLDDHSVVDFQWLQETWNSTERRWKHVGKERVLDEFCSEVNELFHTYTGTELFERNIYDSIETTHENVERFYDALGIVLGLEEWQKETTQKGITNYDYKQIDEDIFGKAYETYLAEIRKEQGIYYTPRYVSQSIVEEVVSERFADVADRLLDAIEDEEWEQAHELAEEFVTIRVLDPACGAGSFLVKAFSAIYDEYDALFDRLSERKDFVQQFEDGTLSTNEVGRGEKGRETVKKLTEIQRTLGYSEDDRGTLSRNERELTSKIVVRHVHGVDLDGRALDVAKLNVWLEAIKRNPEAYRYSEIPEYSLPSLELNLGHGDSLVGLPEARTSDVLRKRFADELDEILRLRAEYLDDPTSETSLPEATALVSDVRAGLDREFEATIADETFPEDVTDATKPFYWPLQFWHVFEDGGGFDCIVGNPPWKIEGKEGIKACLDETYELQSGQPDLYRFFIEKCVALCDGTMGMVTPNTWFLIPGAASLRDEILHTTSVEQVAFVPDSAFEGVSQNIVTFRLDTRAKPSLSEEANDETEDAEIPVGNLGTDGNFSRLRTVSTDDIEADEYRVNLYVGQEEKAISAKMERSSAVLSDIADVTVGYQLYHKGVHTEDEIENEVFHSNRRENEDYVLDTRSAALSRYYLDTSEGNYVDTSPEFFRIPPAEFLNGRKILLREVPSEAKIGLVATMSETELLFPKSVISIRLTDGTSDEISYEQLLGLLNSRLLYLQSLVKGEKMGQNLFPRVSLTQLRGLSVTASDALTPHVEQLQLLSEAKHEFRKTWRKKSENRQTRERSLATILENDRERIQRGEHTKTWSDDVSCYPDSDEEVLKREFSEFSVEGDSDAPVLRIYGIDARVEEEIYRIRFQNRALLQMVYLAVKELFDSRARVERLDDILQKTTVSILRPDTAERAANVVSEVEHEFETRDEKERAYPGPIDIVTIENALRERQAKLDAAVFDCYDLSADEARTVLTVLGLRKQVVEQTLREYADD